MHVKSADPPQGQPQGAAHSQSNFTALAGITPS
jgi:hypothetical protein